MALVGSIFGKNTPVGAVVAVADSRMATFKLVNVEPKLPLAKGIVSGISWQDGVNVQFTHTMGDDIYMNVFGNRMGTMTIKGIAFSAYECKDTDEHGVIEYIDWYKDNRVSKKLAAIVVTVGGKEAIDGYLIGASYNTDDTEHWLVNYQLQVATVPRSS